MLVTEGYKSIMAGVRLDDIEADPWGTATTWAFAIAHVLYIEYGIWALGFCPSPMINTREDMHEHAERELLILIDKDHASSRDLMTAYTVLDRFRGWCVLAGRSY